MLNKCIPLPVRCIYEMPGGIKVAKLHDMAPYEDATPSVPYVSVIVK